MKNFLLILIIFFIIKIKITTENPISFSSSFLGTSSFFLNELANLKGMCLPVTYGGLGDFCNESNLESCYEALWCNSSNICAEQNDGENCTNDSDCSSGLCLNQTCTGKVIARRSCQYDIQCYSGNCTENVCVGIAENQTCSREIPYTCDFGLFCDAVTNTCIPSIQPGKECLNNTDYMSHEFTISCTSGYICSPDNSSRLSGTCQKLYGSNIGDSCYFSFTCLDGLACQNGTCNATQPFCDDTDFWCTDSAHCICDSPISGNCVQAGNNRCGKIMSEITDCMVSKGCLYIIPISNVTCLMAECGDYLKNLQCCLYYGYHDTYFVPPSTVCESCPVQLSFAGIGEYCNMTENKLCYEHLWCNSSNLCDYDNTGNNCSTNTDCAYGVCANGTCSGIKNAGDNCSINDECYSKNCSSNVCVGFISGSSCTPSGSDGQCDKGLFCDAITATCIPSIQPGEECLTHISFQQTDSLLACSSGYICNPTNYSLTEGYCTKLYSATLGNQCVTNEVCEFGLACQNGVCVEQTSYCDQQMMFCSENSYCNCSDNSMNGSCISVSNPSCSSQMNDLRECLINHNCPIGKTSFIQGTCGYDNCFIELNSFECCSQSGYSGSFYLQKGINCSLPSPTYSPSSTSSSESHLGLDLGLGLGIPIFLVIASLILFFVLKKNQKVPKKSSEKANLIINNQANETDYKKF